MFTSDNILGEGTGVVINLKEYLSSLQSLRREEPKRLYPGKRHTRHVSNADKADVFSGHGEYVEDGKELIDEYIAHRRKRCQDVLDSLRRAKNESVSLEQLTLDVYGENLPSSLRGPAMWNVKMALEVLADEKKIELQDGLFRARY